MLSRTNALQSSFRLFSSAQSQTVKSTQTDSAKLINEQKKFVPMQLVSEFGDLLNLKPMNKLVKMKTDATG